MLYHEFAQSLHIERSYNLRGLGTLQPLFKLKKELQEIDSDKEEDKFKRFGNYYSLSCVKLLIKTALENRAHIKEFVNAVFQPIDEKNLSDGRFTKQELSAERIVHRYTDDFKTDASFSTWCSTAGLDFLLVEDFRKISKDDAGQKKKKALVKRTSTKTSR